MKWSFRVLAFVLLLTTIAITLARHDSGAWIAYVSVRGDDRVIQLMTGDGDGLRQLSPENMCATKPHWSPNGAWILFLNPCDNNQDLLRTRLIGKAPQPVTTASTFTTGEVFWSPDSQGLIVPRGERGIFIVEPDTNSERLLAINYDSPQWSPDGAWIYARPRLPTDAALLRIHIETGEAERLLPPEAIFSELKWSPDGAQVMFTMLTARGQELFFMQPDGSNLHALPIDLPPPQISEANWSPDGEWITFLGGETPNTLHIYRVRPDGGELERLSQNAGDLLALQWSPNGEWLLFRQIDETGANIYRMHPDGSSLQNLTPGPGNDYSPEYAPTSGMGWHPALMIVVAIILQMFCTSHKFGQLNAFIMRLPKRHN